MVQGLSRFLLDQISRDFQRISPNSEDLDKVSFSGYFTGDQHLTRVDPGHTRIGDDALYELQDGDGTAGDVVRERFEVPYCGMFYPNTRVDIPCLTKTRDTTFLVGLDHPRSPSRRS